MGETAYTSNWGLLSLREEIARYMQGRYHLTYDPGKEVLVTVGASEGIDLSLRVLMNPGDEVLIPEPSYVSYAPGVVFAGGVPVPVPTSEQNGFALMPEALAAAVTPRTKAVILPYPNNPTGAVLDRPLLERLRDVFVENDLIVISDEIYSELTYTEEGHTSIASLPGMHERTIVLNGFSKAFAMTGWRMGYLCAPRRLYRCDVQDSPVHHPLRAPTGPGSCGRGAAAGAGRTAMRTWFPAAKATTSAAG